MPPGLDLSLQHWIQASLDLSLQGKTAEISGNQLKFVEIWGHGLGDHQNSSKFVEIWGHGLGHRRNSSKSVELVLVFSILILNLILILS